MRTLLAAIVVVALPRIAAALRRIRLHRALHRARPRASDSLRLAELTALGLSAGHTFPIALAEAASAVPALADEARAVSREAHRVGFAEALTRAGDGAGGLYRIAARTATTGAPLLPAVQARLDELRGAERLRRLERIRTLPVKMLFPLALLILPGFLVLTVAPTLLGALDRLRL